MSERKWGHCMSKLDIGLHPIWCSAQGRTIKRTNVLAIWDRMLERTPICRAMDFDQIVFAEFEEINVSTLDMFEPDAIVSPVVANTFDCIDLVQKLLELGYRGVYRAIAQQMPNPEIVRREVRALHPALDFDILILSESNGIRH